MYNHDRFVLCMTTKDLFYVQPWQICFMYDHEGFVLCTTMKPVKGMQQTEMPDQMTLSTNKNFLKWAFHFLIFFHFQSNKTISVIKLE